MSSSTTSAAQPRTVSTASAPLQSATISMSGAVPRIIRSPDLTSRSSSTTATRITGRPFLLRTTEPVEPPGAARFRSPARDRPATDPHPRRAAGVIPRPLEDAVGRPPRAEWFSCCTTEEGTSPRRVAVHIGGRRDPHTRRPPLACGGGSDGDLPRTAGERPVVPSKPLVRRLSAALQSLPQPLRDPHGIPQRGTELNRQKPQLPRSGPRIADQILGVLQQPDSHPELHRLHVIGVPGDISPTLPVREQETGFAVGGGPGEAAGVGCGLFIGRCPPVRTP